MRKPLPAQILYQRPFTFGLYGPSVGDVWEPISPPSGSGAIKLLTHARAAIPRLTFFKVGTGGSEAVRCVAGASPFTPTRMHRSAWGSYKPSGRLKQGTGGLTNLVATRPGGSDAVVFLEGAS
jgi:hypothetical protein